MEFCGRNYELETLNSAYQSVGFEFTVIYGRRRIGKTALIAEYIKDKPSIYYMATETDGMKNLQGLSREINRFLGREMMASYRLYEDAFRDIVEISKRHYDIGALLTSGELTGNLSYNIVAESMSENKLVFVIDEYPYLAENYPEISSIIQKFCDHDWKNANIHFILCGSAMSFMENQVLGVKSPLYGRRTSQIKLRAFRYQESADYLHGMDKFDVAVLHAITGGVVEYLSYVDKRLELGQNICHLFLKTNGRLFEEPSNLLKQELREPKKYNSILDAIANGASKNSEIASKSGLDSGALTPYINALIELGIVVKEIPFGKKNSRKTIYRITDGSFRFWYRYNVKYGSLIELNLGEEVYNKYIQNDISNFMGYGFEQICYDIFDEMNKKGELPDLFYDRGRWWGSNPETKQNEEIDLVAESSEMMLFSEMKWRNEKCGLDVLSGLIEKSNLFSTSKEKCYLLFSKSGFTKSVIEKAKSNKIILCKF